MPEPVSNPTARLIGTATIDEEYAIEGDDVMPTGNGGRTGVDIIRFECDVCNANVPNEAIEDHLFEHKNGEPTTISTESILTEKFTSIMSGPDHFRYLEPGDRVAVRYMSSRTLNPVDVIGTIDEDSEGGKDPHILLKDVLDPIREDDRSDIALVYERPNGGSKEPRAKTVRSDGKETPLGTIREITLHYRGGRDMDDTNSYSNGDGEEVSA